MTDKPLTIRGELWRDKMELRRTEKDPGYVTVILKIPAEPLFVCASANDAYEYFNKLGAKPTPFIMTVGDKEE